MHLQQELKDTGVRIMNFHPGTILTASAREVGMTEDSLPWDNANLP